MNVTKALNSVAFLVVIHIRPPSRPEFAVPTGQIAAHTTYATFEL
jgi:hypothetical protein